MERLVILLDHPADFVATLLLRAALDAVCARRDITLAGICVRQPKSYPRLAWRHLRDEWRRHLRCWWENRADPAGRQPWPPDLHRLARRAGGRMLTPPLHDLNHPDFVTELRTMVRPTLALTLLCEQRYGRDLLEALGYSVNYHNGQLPEYRGLHATRWSVYHRAVATGFTFHRMDEHLDCGPILLAGALPIAAAADLRALEYAKTQAAMALLPQVLELMVARSPGTPQSGAAGYFSGKHYAAIRTIADPTALTSGELVRRLQAFGSLFMAANGRWFSVTQLETTVPRTPHGPKPCFKSADGVWLRATRLRRHTHFQSP